MSKKKKVSQKEFYDRIKPLIRPGDVINFDSRAPWYKIHFKIAYWGIRRHHKRLFGRLARWRDTHTMLYFDDCYVFSVEPPRCRWWRLEELNDENISVWRYTKQGFTAHDIGIMCWAAHQMIGHKYDKGQLVDFMINEALGYPDRLRYRVLDAGLFEVIDDNVAELPGPDHLHRPAFFAGLGQLLLLFDADSPMRR